MAKKDLEPIPSEQLRMKRRKALRQAQRVFREYPLIRLIVEHEYESERRAIMERLPPGIALHEVETYNVSDPVYQALLRLQKLTHKYRYYLRRYHAVNDVLALLDDETKRLVKFCYFDRHSLAWVRTHADEVGVYCSERTMKRYLWHAKQLLAKRLGWWPG